MQQKPTSRRAFISNAGKAGLAVSLSFTALKDFAAAPANNSWEPSLVQTPLPYGYADLEKAIDAQTMEIHYTKHAATYAKNLHEAIAEEYKAAPAAHLIQLLEKADTYSTKFRNNAGGHYNHELFWQCMSPNGTGTPSGQLLAKINEDFGSFDAFKTKFSDAAKTRFGSGWAWLIVTKAGKLAVTSTPNQDNPLMPFAEQRGYPILGLDVWEHAYYLKYQNKRPDYIGNWWSVVNWNFVEQRFLAHHA